MAVITSKQIPIENRVSGIFVHVSDLRRAAEWYNELLGLPLNEEMLGDGSGPVYWYYLPGTSLILDNDAHNRLNSQWTKANAPQFMFSCRDIDAAYAYVQKKAKPLFEPERHPGMAYFNFSAPDGRVFMVCSVENPLTELKEPRGSSPVRVRIGGVFVNVCDMRAAAGWMSDLLGQELREAETTQSIYSVPTTSGAALLLDDNRVRNGETFEIPFMFVSDDIDAAFAYARERGLDIFHGIERPNGGPLAFFALRDPDGNLVMICQGDDEA
jgi:catechol 2,3-dioxygenase-like lactoylglutathione lyase family enzyme